MNFKTIMNAGIDMEVTDIEIVLHDNIYHTEHLEWCENADAWSYYDEKFFTVEDLGNLEVMAIKKANYNSGLRVFLRK